MEFAEPWIKQKLLDRLMAYKVRYPNFNVERVMEEVCTWDAQRQRWAPYMNDKDIKKINRAYHRARSFASLAESQS